MQIKSITPAGKADVYNMEVADVHDFAVENGVIIHNCYDDVRYMCQYNPIAPRKPQIFKPKAYDPLSTDTTEYERYAAYSKF